MGRERLVGVALVAVSAAAFGTAGVLARAAYDDGTDPTGLLVCRFVLATVVFASVGFVRRRRPRLRPGLVVMGGGYFLQSFLYFTAVDHASPGLVALLLYTYPALVVVLAAAVLRTPIGRTVAVACAVALAGTAVVVGPTAGDASGLGIACGLGAAVVYSGYILLGSRVLTDVDPLAASTVIMATAAAGYVAVFAVARPSLPSSAGGWAAVAAVAVVCTVVAVLTFLAGLARIGPADASTVSTVEPVVSVVLSAAVLHEAITGWTVLGGLLVAGAVVTIGRAEPRRVRSAPMYRKVLVGTDGSRTAAKAVDRAVEVASASGATLTIMSAGRPDKAGAVVEAEAERHAGSGVTIDTKVVDDDPVAALCQLATDGGYDLLVVGNRGMTGMTRFLRLGSVPNKVSHHLPSSLLIVKTT